MVKGSNLKGEDKEIKIKVSDSKKKRKKSRESSEPIELKKGRKKSGSTQKEKKQRVKPLDPLREQLNVLVQQANERVQQLVDRGIQSRALEEAKRSLKRMPTRVDDEQMGVIFRSDLSNRAQINRELARVHSFLNDYTSTSSGAYDFESKLKKYKGAFGGEWEAEYGKRYDITRIEEEKAKLAFDIYRRVIERAGGWERAVGIFQGKESLIGYGSENLIIAIYDMVDNISVGKTIGDTFISDETDRRDFIVNRGFDIIDAGIKAYNEMASKQVADFDYGIVFDDEDTKARREWFAWLFDNRKKLRK